MVGAETVTGAYLSMALLTLIGIAVPLGAFITQFFCYAQGRLLKASHDKIMAYGGL